MAWRFSKESVEDGFIGFNENSIQQFGENVEKSIVREALQNSMDAGVKGSKDPVSVEFKTFSLPKDALFGFQDIERHLQMCAKQEPKNDKIKKCIDLIERNAYSLLEISDYNTNGMLEEDLHALVKDKFLAYNKSKDSQGGAGIGGKSSFMAASYLRSFLVSTVSKEGFRFKGRTQLCTRQDDMDKSIHWRDKGFYNDDYRLNLEDLPEKLKRSEQGSSIFIVGYKSVMRDVKGEYIREVLRNYWLSILHNKLIVNVFGSELNNDNILKYIEEYFPNYKDFEKSEFRSNPRAYAETVSQGTLYKREIPRLGECKLWLKKNDEYPGFVSRHRKSRMLIYKTKEIESGFAGVFLCTSKSGNEVLKDMEGAKHDKWTQHKGNKEDKEVLESIKEFISDSFREFAGLGKGDSFTIDVLDDMFGIDLGGKISNPKPKPPIDPKPPVDDPVEPTPRNRLIKQAKFKYQGDKNGGTYTVAIDCKEDAPSQALRFKMATDSSFDEIGVLASGSGSVVNGQIKIDLKQGKNIIENVKLDSPFMVAPEVEVVQEK